MAYSFSDVVQMSPVALAELSINRAMETIERQRALLGFQSDHERASQAIVQVAGPEFSTTRWINPVAVDLMGGRTLMEASMRLEAFFNSNLIGPMERALERDPVTAYFSSRASLSRRDEDTSEVFVSATATREQPGKPERVILAMIDDSSVARHLPDRGDRSGQWMKHPGHEAIWWSPEVYRMLGFSLSGGLLTDDDIANCFVPASGHQFAQMVDSLECGKGSATIEVQAVGSDGFRRTLRVMAKHQASGRIEGTVEDVTPYRLSAARSEPDLRRLTHVLSVLRRIEATKSMEELTRLVTSKVREITGAEGATFVLKDEDQVHYLDENAVKPLWKGQKFDIKHCISGWAMQYESPAVIPDIYADPRIPIEYYRPTFVQSLMMVPVRGKQPGLAIGAYFARKYAATLEDLAVMRAIADSASKAMEGMGTA